MNAELFNVRIVIILLGLIATVSLTFAGLLALDEKAIPDILVATVSGSLAALGALLSKTSTGPQEVQVMNQPADPVPTKEK